MPVRQFAISSRSGAAGIVVSVRGELDLTAAPLLEREFCSIEVLAAPVVVFDLEQVDFIDLSGLRPIVALALPPRPGHCVRISVGAPAVRRLLELTGLGEHLNLVSGPPV